MQSQSLANGFGLFRFDVDIQVVGAFFVPKKMSVSPEIAVMSYSQTHWM